MACTWGGGYSMIGALFTRLSLRPTRHCWEWERGIDPSIDTWINGSIYISINRSIDHTCTCKSRELLSNPFRYVHIILTERSPRMPTPVEAHPSVHRQCTAPEKLSQPSPTLPCMHVSRRDNNVLTSFPSHRFLVWERGCMQYILRVSRVNTSCCTNACGL